MEHVTNPFYCVLFNRFPEAESSMNMLTQKSASYMVLHRLLFCSLVITATCDGIYQLINSVMRVVLFRERLLGR